jgi:hypothetical protein
MSDEKPALALAGLVPAGLTNEESEFVYNVEVLGLPVRKAASMAGLPIGSSTKPHIAQAREVMRREIRGSLQVTKEDVTYGIQEAIGRAKILGEPMVEIVGWEKLAKLHGLDAPTKIDINLNASIEVLEGNIRSMSNADLVKALGADSVIDGEFYEIGKDR